jgi:hypothetical protein
VKQKPVSKMKRSIIYTILCILSLNGFSQTVITGTINDEKGEPLPGASVYLQGTYDGTSGNEKGEYLLKTKKTGDYDLKVEFMGYESALKKLSLKGDTLHVNIQLKESFNELNAVTITAGTFEASDKKQAVTITPLDMVTTAGAKGDVFGALQSLPGTTTNGESGRLFVKGGDSEESQTYIDGSLVYVPYNSSAPNLSTRGRFNPFMFKGTIFSTGGYSAEYGQALSSVLLLSTNDMPVEDQLDLSFMSIGVEAAGTKLWKNGAATASLTYNNLNPYMSLTPQNYNWIHAPESAKGALSIRQKTGKTGFFKLYSSFNKDAFTINEENPDSVESNYDYHLANKNFFINASWNGLISEKWSMNSAASYTKNEDDIRFGQTTIVKKIEGAHLKNTFTYPFTEKFSLKFGGELFAKTFSQNVTMPSELHDNNFTNNILAGFAEAQVYASAKFVTRIGARAEYSDYLKSFRLSPRLSTAYKITEDSQFSLAYGWFYQNPLDDYLLYTNRLNPERADHYTFSFQSSINGRTLRAEIYYKDYKDLVKTNGSIYLPANYSNKGGGYAKGLDLFWRDSKTIKNGNYWISYSYLDTKRDYRDFPGEEIPTFASTHNLSVVYKHWITGLRSLAGINFKYSSPRVYNDPNSKVFNSERMLPYRSLDLSWSFLYRKNIIFYGAVTNVLGFKNEYGRRYSDSPDAGGIYSSVAIQPSSNRFYVIACFITLSRKGEANQLDKNE